MPLLDHVPADPNVAVRTAPFRLGDEETIGSLCLSVCCTEELDTETLAFKLGLGRRAPFRIPLEIYAIGLHLIWAHKKVGPVKRK
jgi:hypothetical protein